MSDRSGVRFATKHISRLVDPFSNTSSIGGKIMFARLKLYGFPIVVVLVVTLLAGCGTGGARGGASGSGATEKQGTKPITIKVTTVQLPQQQLGKAALDFAKAVNEKMGDQVQVTAYTGAQLYSGAEELEALRKGEIQVVFAIGSMMETLDQTMQIFKMPYLFPSDEVAYKVLDGSVGQQLFKNIEAKGIRVAGVVSSGRVVVSNNKRELRRPADFRGLKMRSSGRVETSILEALGATAIVTPSEETLTALQQGVIDGMSTPSSVFLQRRYYDVQKYLTDAGLIYWPFGVVLINKEFWNGLPDDVRNQLDGILKDQIAQMRSQIASETQKVLDEIAAKGVKVYRLTDEEVAAWREATAKVYDQYAGQIGADIIKAVRDEVARFSGK